MNAALLLEHYARIADAPNAIARLRQFVLDLAVRGKLIEQDAGDEPASELLERISAEKVRLVKAGEIRKPRTIPDLAEQPFALPSSWCWSQIGEIGIINPRVDADDNAMTSFVPMPLIAAEYGVPNRHEPRPWGKIKKGYTHFAEGDVGLAKITPCFENGKSTVFQNLTGGIGSGTTELHVVRPLFVNPSYILVFWKCPFFIENGIPKMTGTAGQKRVPMDYFANSPFPLPPLAEQHRIVAKVDELMTLCDQLEAARVSREAARDMLTLSTLSKCSTPDPETFGQNARFALANFAALTARADQIKQVRQTILDLAVRGKLVIQDPDDEPASEQLRRIGDVKSTSQIAKQAARHGKRSDRLPSCNPLPPGWARSTLGELALSMRYGTSVKCERKAKGAAVLRIPNVSSGVIDLNDLKFGPLSKKEQDDLALEAGDLLIIRSNGSLAIVGRSAVVTQAAAGMSFAGYLVRVRLLQGAINSRYLRLALESTNARNAIEMPIRTTVGLKNLNLTELGALSIPVPPIAEQYRIVAKVDELTALCDQLEVSIDIGERTCSRLLDALLHNALEPVYAQDSSEQV